MNGHRFVYIYMLYIQVKHRKINNVRCDMYNADVLFELSWRTVNVNIRQRHHLLPPPRPPPIHSRWKPTWISIHLWWTIAKLVAVIRKIIVLGCRWAYTIHTCPVASPVKTDAVRDEASAVAKGITKENEREERSARTKWEKYGSWNTLLPIIWTYNSYTSTCTSCNTRVCVQHS